MREARVLVVGAGGTGSPLLYYLAAAGVGQIRVCDGDTLELSNLNRQILHDESRLGLNKAHSAALSLTALNSDVEVTVCPEMLTVENLEYLAHGVGLICCAVDDLETTRLLGRFCARESLPLVWAGCYFMGGFVTVVHSPSTPCVECCLAGWEKHRRSSSQHTASKNSRLLPTAQRPGPIVGAAAGATGSMQAMEAIKILVGFGPVLKGSMLAFQLSGAGMPFETFDLNPLRRSDCPDCGNHEST